MDKKDKKPLGYISLLNNTTKPIYPTDDFFINYAFYKSENWQHLRNLINIFLDAYATKYNRQDGFHLVDENIIVKTQYEHFVNRKIALHINAKLSAIFYHLSSKITARHIVMTVKT